MAITIADQKRQNLPRILKQLGMTQRDIAKALVLSPGAISKYLAIGSGHARLRPERVQRLVQVLKQRLADCQSAHGKGELDSESPALAPETARALQAEINELLTDEQETAKAVLGPPIAAPGGAMPVNAENYIRRPPDEKIDEILAPGGAPANLVIAPICGGSSSFLNRVYHRARSDSNNWVKIVHLDAAFVEGETINQVQLFRYLLRSIDVPQDKLVDDVEQMKEAFELWAEDAWRGIFRAVLIIDGLDQVFKHAPLHETLTFVNWLATLRSRAAIEPPYNKLALFTAFTGRTWSAAHASPYGSQAAQLWLKKFTRNEVKALFDVLQIHSTDEQIEDVYDLFNGHPYLTQLFAWSLLAGADHLAAKKMALNLEESYDTHWERMKTEIEFLVRADPALSADVEMNIDELLVTVCRVIDNKGDQRLTGKARSLWEGKQRDLRIFGLIDGTAAVPKMCDFYRNAIEITGTRKDFLVQPKLIASSKDD